MSIPRSFRDARILIAGAGPAGLGAAHRLTELGCRNYLLVEGAQCAGGLSGSFKDSSGFTWDIGGHVLFSHYEYFDRLMDDLLRDEWLTHERESWIWLYDRFIPYPFQQNIRRLPPPFMRECLEGLIECVRRGGKAAPSNFEEWILASFGDGISRHFMLPYNEKVWAYPARTMSYRWIGERVAEVDLCQVVFNILEERDERGWGPNNTFRFPKYGGTGEIWRRLAARLPSGAVAYGRRLTRLDARAGVAHFQDGSREAYDALISTVPVDALIRRSDLPHLNTAAAALKHSSTHVVGLGLKGAPPPQLKTKCWMYFPSDDVPCYRATVFSNYSPFNVPDASSFWSLMLEVSESPEKPVDAGRLVDSSVAGLMGAGMIGSASEIVDAWTYRAEYGYPTPSLDRDAALEVIHPELERHNVFSRGRFGGWKYEIGNQDHCFMQGVEIVDRLVLGSNETTFKLQSSPARDAGLQGRGLPAPQGAQPKRRRPARREAPCSQ